MKNKIIRVTVSENEHKIIKEKAIKSGLTMAAYLRNLGMKS